MSVLLLAVLALAVVGFLMQSAVAIGWLAGTQPRIQTVDVTTVNDTHERVTWRTPHDGNTSVTKYVKVEGGPWYAVETVAADGAATNHSVSTDVHAVRELAYRNETISPNEVEGYRAQITAWRNGEVEAFELLHADRSKLAFDGRSLQVDDSVRVETPE